MLTMVLSSLLVGSITAIIIMIRKDAITSIIIPEKASNQSIDSFACEEKLNSNLTFSESIAILLKGKEGIMTKSQVKMSSLWRRRRFVPLLLRLLVKMQTNEQ